MCTDENPLWACSTGGELAGRHCGQGSDSTGEMRAKRQRTHQLKTRACILHPKSSRDYNTKI